MDCHKIHDNLGSINVEELERRANKTIEFPQLAITTGNAITLSTMLALQEIIKQLAVNPIANVSNIIELSNSIANLNSSIKTIQ
jgi:hypothetical protein